MSTDDERILERFKGVAVVVCDQERFIKKLGIGEDAYKSLTILRDSGTVVNVTTAATLGGMVASSGTVAGTFFASTSWLGAIGLAPVAATPIGWVLGAAVLTGGAYYGAMRAFGAYRKALVDDVPRFINAPIDALGAAIVDMLGAMALRVAVADGAICNTEQTHIRDYFIDEWGIDESYAHEALAVIEENLDKASLEQLVATFARFAHRQHDCKLDILRQRLEELLRDLVQADGSITPEESDAISCIIDGLKSSGRGGSLPHLAKTWIGRVFMGVPEAAKQQPA